jgi:soluble lytic murein transglycosylase
MRSIILIMLIMWLNHNVYASNSIEQQRSLFLQAHKAYQQRDYSMFTALMQELNDYPLYGFLRALDLERQPASDTELLQFLRQYGDTDSGAKLRRDWLQKLAQQGRWDMYLQAYTPQSSIALQCYELQAKVATKQADATTLQQIKQLWLVGNSQPAACDGVFEHIYSLIDDNLLWQRINLAMYNNQLSLAQSIARRLPAEQQKWMAIWAEMQQPNAKLLEFNFQDSHIAREILAYGIHKLAEQVHKRGNIEQLSQVAKLWEELQTKYAFSEVQIAAVQRALAEAGLKNNSFFWLAIVDEEHISEELQLARLNLALNNQHWLALIDFIQTTSQNIAEQPQWQYWYARALAEQGEHKRAKKIYSNLAKERDYYGFLAADKINADYNIYHQTTQFTKNDWDRINRHIGVRQAYEFYQLDMHTHWRRAWNAAVDSMSDQDKAIAARVARYWNWYDTAIFTAAKAKAFDDLDVRFPMPHLQVIKQQSELQNVDLAWVYGVIRQESAFASHARSHAGAMGLMQLMPATGRAVARKIGLSVRNNNDIFQLDNNIALGSGYLRQMLDRFDGNYMLATAAYNAGPGRAVRWAQQNQCMPADLWVEMIPFNETRTYVKRVMFYTAIFEARLGKKPTNMRLYLDSSNCGDIYYVQTEQIPRN